MPDWPSSRPFHVESRSTPSEVVAAMDVTTTLGKLPPSVENSRATRSRVLPLGDARGDGCSSLGVLFLELLDVGDGVTHGAQAGEVPVGHLHAVLVLDLDGDLDQRQRVDVQVVDEGLRSSPRRVDPGHFLDDLGDTGDEFFLSGSHDVVPFIYVVVVVLPEAAMVAAWTPWEFRLSKFSEVGQVVRLIQAHVGRALSSRLAMPTRVPAGGSSAIAVTRHRAS